MRIGILGGSFNPPHVGHMTCARAARDLLGLDCVLLIPALEPPHKRIKGDPGAEVRLALCERAIAAERGIAVSRIELDRPPPSYTVDTLEQLHERAPKDELTLIAGGDVARSLPRWRDPGRILELARLAIAERAGARREQIVAELEPLGGHDRVTFLDMPAVDVSSSEVRRRVAAGEPIDELVPDAVARTIASEGLYRP
ncbi:MAG TPA: nicotinate-nucleotide adenylyltransferase [Solirubrobacteraceae bacterium]|nr:nicotinate-nucleotide adenylyltransferase [Solirubrobacteraceae bacterium]